LDLIEIVCKILNRGNSIIPRDIAVCGKLFFTVSRTADRTENNGLYIVSRYGFIPMDKFLRITSGVATFDRPGFGARKRGLVRAAFLGFG
jgi:hypothetical protein